MMYINLLVQWLQSHVESEEGQDLIEYALLVVLIAIVVVAALTALGPIISGVFDEIAGELGGTAS